VNNVFRAVLAEAIIARALAPDWEWCSGDWAPFDFQHRSGCSLEVKQSAALQSWHEASKRTTPTVGGFDIARRKFQWHPEHGWVADAFRPSMYVFAWHPVGDPKQADHRDAGQWQFHVVAAKRLPEQKSISLSRIMAMAQAVDVQRLPGEVETTRSNLQIEGSPYR